MVVNSKVSGKLPFKTNSIFFVLSLLSIILVFALSLNAAFWSDDFIFYMRLKEQSLFSYMWSGYLTWDGRFFSLPGIAQALLIKHTNAPLAILFWSSCFFLTSWFIGKFIFHASDRLNANSRRTNSFTDIILLFLFLWFGFHLHLSETVYRVVGGFYIFSLLLALLYFWFYENRPTRLSAIWLIMGFIVSLAVGLMGVNGSFTLIVYILLDLFVKRKFYNQNRRLLWYPLLWGFALVISTLFILVAPGNFVRASHHETSFVFDPLMTLFYFVEIFARYTYYSWPAIAAGIVTALIFPLSQTLKDGIRFIIPSFRALLSFAFPKTVDEFVKRHFWLFVAIASIIPMLAVPEITSRRTSVFYMAFLFIWVVGFVRGINTHSYVNEKNGFQVHILSAYVRNFLLVFLFTTILTAIYHFSLGYQIKTQVIAREAYLAEMQGKVDTVYVNPIVVDKIPFSYKFHDLLHQGYANYYGFDKVVLDTNALKELPYYYVTPP